MSSEGLKPYGECNNVARSIPSAIPDGSWGSSADLPVTTWNSPLGNTNTLSILDRYQSKSQRKSLWILGISNKVAEGVPEVGNILDIKSNVEQFTNAGDPTVPVPLNRFLTPGRKSR